MNYYKLTAIVLFITIVTLSTVYAEGNGSGAIGIGYVFIDEDGNQSVNQETFNTYEGVGLSLEDWAYQFNNGVSVRANLANITLNNRNLTFSADKPGLFSFNIRNNQYRRVYDSYGDRFTRRRTTESMARFQPNKHITIFGGYGVTEKHGDDLFLSGPISDTTITLTDYKATRYRIGTQIYDKYGYVRAEYRAFDLEDRLSGSRDRKAGSFSLDASSVVPGYHWIFLSGGYHYRQDKIDAYAVKLTTNQLWGGAKLYLTKAFVFDYRFVFARTKHTGTGLETDNWRNIATIGHTWAGSGGLRVGYESRIVDDLVDRTVSNGLLVSGWYNYKKRLIAKLRVSTRQRDVKAGTVLTGDKSDTRHRIMVTYRQPGWGDLSVTWKNKIHENEDIGSKVDYNVATLQLNTKREQLGRATVTYSYYLGQYNNRSNEISYEFSDHTLTGMLYPKVFDKMEFGFGGTYYRSRRDQNIEKFSINLSALYTLNDIYHLQVKYDVYNFDNYLLLGNYYTSNIVAVSLIRDFKL